MIAERYDIPAAEREKILAGAFASLVPLKLKRLPSKEKKKVVVLEQIALQFQKDRHYTEKEVNEILVRVYEDFVTLRRHLVDFGYLDRTRNGSEYWVP